MSSAADAVPSASRGLNYIEHQVSKMDTLAGVAIKYGVEVADIKRMNGLATDLQMFALKSLQIPSPGRHPPSSRSSNGPVSLGESSPVDTSLQSGRSKIVGLYQSSRIKSPPQSVSSAMNSLQSYYGLKPPNHKGAAEGTEMATYRTERSHFSGNGSLPKALSNADPLLHHHKYGNASTVLMPANGIANGDSFGDGEGGKSNEKPIRRRQKAETDFGAKTPERLLRVENGGGSGGFSAITGKGLALRPKSASRTCLVADGESGQLSSAQMGLGESFTVDGRAGVRKSSSTPSLPDQELNNYSSPWATSKWNLKQDLQALSSVSIAKPLFDGLPKPITGLWNKAARD